MAEHHDSWFESVFGAVASVGKSIGHAAEEVGHAAVVAGEAVGHAAVVAGEAVGHAAVVVGETVGHAVVTAEQAIVHGAVAVGHAVEDVVQHIVDPEGAAKKDFAEAIAAFDKTVTSLGDAGLETSHYVARGKQLRAEYAAAAALTDKDPRVTGMKAAAAAARDEAKRAETDTGRTKTAAVEGVSKAIKAMRDSAEKLVRGLPDTNAKKAELQKALADVDKSIAEDVKITDRPQRAKHEKITQKLAEELLDRAGDESHDKAAVQETYRKALEERYGFKVSNDEGLNTHNDQVYKMFDKVPDADVTQDKLKAFKYSSTMPDGTPNPSAFYAPGDEDIVFSSYADDGTLSYQDPVTGVAESPNSFSISTLHELGHSVDDRFGIMRSHQGKPGAGGWQTETIANVAKAYADAFQAGAGAAHHLPDATVKGLVTTALGGTVPAKPGDMAADAWTALQPTLNNCTQRLSGSSPWNTLQDVGGRTYHNSGNGWVSYLSSSRSGGPSVSGYQWRSPAEFFAEFYAWTYYNSKPAPSAVEAGLTAYMYGGASANPPTAH